MDTQNTPIQNTQLYAKIVETASEGIWVIDEHNVTTFINDHMAHLLGYSREEMLGASLFDFMDQEGKDIALKNIERRKQGIKESHDFRFLKKDGTYIWTIISTSPLFDDAHVYRGAIGLVTDITEHKTLIQQSNLFRLALERASNHIIITDADGVITFANNGVEKTTGYTKEEVIGQTPKLWGGQMDSAFYRQFWQTIKEEKKIFYGEIQNKRKNGEQYWAISTVSPIVDADRLIGFIGVEEDISARKDSERILKEKVEELTKFNELTVNRELKMAQLKEELAKTNAELTRLKLEGR